MKLKRTTKYTLTAMVPSPNAALDTMTEFMSGLPGVELAGSFHTGATLTLRFRMKTNDTAATQVATTLLDLLSGNPVANLHTGVGINRRLVAQQ